MGHPGAPPRTGGGAAQPHRTREPHQGECSRQGGGGQRGKGGNQDSGNRKPERRGMQEQAHGGQRQHRRWPGQPALLLPGARATPAQPASGGGCLPQPRWAVCATGAGAHQGQTSREWERDMWWTAGTARGGAGHLGLMHTETETRRGRLWMACGRRCGRQKQSNDPRNNQHNPQYANYWAPLTRKRHILPRHTKPLGSANAETTPAGAPAAVADRKQRPDATCEGKNGGLTVQGLENKQQPDGLSHRGTAWVCGGGWQCSMTHHS